MKDGTISNLIHVTTGIKNGTIGLETEDLMSTASRISAKKMLSSGVSIK